MQACRANGSHFRDAFAVLPWLRLCFQPCFLQQCAKCNDREDVAGICARFVLCLVVCITHTQDYLVNLLVVAASISNAMTALLQEKNNSRTCTSAFIVDSLEGLPSYPGRFRYVLECRSNVWDVSPGRGTFLQSIQNPIHHYANT